MKNAFVIIMLVFVALFFLVNNKEGSNKHIAESYPWQIKILPDGRTSVFGVVLDETTLKQVDLLLKGTPKVAMFEVDNKLSLEAYYKNVSLGGLIGSFIFTLDVKDEELIAIKNSGSKKTRSEVKGYRYDLDKPTTDKSKSLVVKNLIYIPTVQLDEETIITRFGEPAKKIKLKTKEAGWHYLYPKKGLDLIYKAESKEVLQYIQPTKFNALLAPLLSDQNQKH